MWNKSKQLRTVGDMSLPDDVQTASGDQVLPLVLSHQFDDEMIQLGHCSLRAKSGGKITRLAFVVDHADSRSRFLAWTKSAESAAGVTPGTLPAAAKVPGRADERRSIISLESPGTDAKG